MAMVKRGVIGHVPALLLASAFAALLSSAPALAQPAPAGASGQGTIELRMLSCCRPSYFGPAVATWTKANPSMPVQQEVVPFAQLTDIMESRLRSRDSSFDIMIVDPPRTAGLAARNYLVDLTPTLGPIAVGKINPESLAGTTYNDKLYAAPVFNSTQILIYNTDLLAAAGVSVPSIDPAHRTTWEKLVTDARTVMEKTKVPNGIAWSQGQGYYQLQQIIMSAGGDIGLTGSNMMTPEVNTPAWKKAMTWYGGLFSSGISPRGVPFTQMDTLFTGGKAPFLVTTSDRVKEFTNQKLPFGVAAVPMFEGGRAVTACDSFAVGINPFSPNQAQALAFITWLSTTREGGIAAAAESPNVPANLVVLDEVNQAMESARPNLAGLAKLIRHETTTTCVHRPRSLGYIQMETAFNEANADIVNGQEAGARLDLMQKRLETTYSRMR
jgi:ABC-type glycerol-3-phosphate transport system substrate-binding protein